MNCEIFRGETLVAQNIPFEQQKVRNIVAKHGGNPNVIPTMIGEKLTTGSIVIYPSVTITEPHPHKVENGEEREIINDVVTYTQLYRDKTITEMSEELLRDLSTVHDTYEQGRVSYNDVFIKIDLEARINVTGLVDNFASGALTSTAWRGSNDKDGNGVATVAITSTEEAQALKQFIVGSIAKGFEARGVMESEITTAVSEGDIEAIKGFNVYERFYEIIAQ